MIQLAKITVCLTIGAIVGAFGVDRYWQGLAIVQHMKVSGMFTMEPLDAHNVRVVYNVFDHRRIDEIPGVDYPVGPSK